MTSRRTRWITAGLAVFAVCALGAAVGSAWLLGRALTAPPAALEPAEYGGFQVTVTDRCLLIRNTGPDAFFTGQIRYRVARADGTGTPFDGDHAFIDWLPGEDVVIFLPAGFAPGRVVVEFTGTAQKVPAGPEFRLRYGPTAPPPDGLSGEDIGFDPDLAAATDREP
jgi:hypothetical protein